MNAKCAGVSAAAIVILSGAYGLPTSLNAGASGTTCQAPFQTRAAEAVPEYAPLNPQDTVMNGVPSRASITPTTSGVPSSLL